MPTAITLHLLAVIIWVGGMFFAYMALRPAASELDPAQRLPLWSKTFSNFFPWVWLAVILIPATGYLMIFQSFGGFTSVGKYIHIMHGLGLLMIVLFVYVFTLPYQGLKRAIASGDLKKGARQLNQIRILIGINLSLGIITTIVATAGAYWLN